MNLELLKKLSNASGTSGFESGIEKIMKTELTSYVDEFTKDNLGSLIAIKKGIKNGPKIMLAAHMDEVGFIINRIDDEGFVYFSPVGGWWDQVLLGQRVKVITQNLKEYIGVIGSKPPHVLDKETRSKVFKQEDMFIDLGVTSKEELIKVGVNIGDMIVPDSNAIDMISEDFLLGKAWDDRVGCFVLIEVMRRLNDINHDATVYAVSTVQEEIGLKGAKTSATKINPDIAIALDTGIGADTPQMTPKEGQCKLGEGPLVVLMDGGMIIHQGLKKYINEISENNKIPYQPEIMTGGSTDAASIQLTNTGVPTTAISLATRYIHSHNSIISKKDIESTIDLVLNLILNLTSEKLEEINGK